MNRLQDHRRLTAARQGTFLLLCAAIVACASAAQAQSSKTEHTLKLDDRQVQPPASFDDIAWMIGSWKGEAFGGTFEETWLPPSAGTMTGAFKLMHEGRPSMYEFMMIVQENDSLSVRLKHFNADFSAWEDKAQFVSFPLAKLTDDAAYFEGLTYRRLDDDRLVVHVSVGEDEEEHELNFVRTPARSGVQTSPYAGFGARRIKSLSSRQIAGYMAGEGMGLAMAAELNGYPGPKHVLELHDELGLSPEQLAATQSSFEVMRSAAVELGAKLVKEEEELDRVFAGHRITLEELESRTSKIARLQGELRAVHLKAHLRMVEILSPAQRHAYLAARGYHGGGMIEDHHPGADAGHG
jgi:Spy/CpxP family protein refolding chaperone